MKRILSVFLVIAFMFALASCGESETANAKTNKKNSADSIYVYDKLVKDEYAGKFRAGFSRSTITPGDTHLPMQGYGNEAKRICKGVLSELFTSCIAVSDEDNNTMILIQNDLIGLPQGTGLADNIAALITKHTGVPKDNIVLTQTHTHSGPTLGYTGMTAVQVYHQFLMYSIANNAVKAMNDRAPVSKMYYGDTQVPDHNFVRHYIVTDGKGDVRHMGDNTYDTWFWYDTDASTRKFLDYASGIDQTFHMIKFERPDKDKKDIIWTSFRAHNTYTGSSDYTKVSSFQFSADWVGELVKYLEEDLDVYCLYAQGDAGDVNPESYFPANEVLDYSDFREHARTLSDYAVKLYDNLKEVKTGPVGGKRFSMTFQVNHAMDSFASRAQLVADYWKKGVTSNEAKHYAYTLGLVSQYQANAILAKASYGKEVTFDMQVYAIGPIGVNCTPGELFNQLGVKSRELNPFEIPISISYTGTSYGYFPDSEAYDYGCYEVDTCKQAKGSGEQMIEEFAKQLTELKKRLKS